MTPSQLDANHEDDLKKSPLPISNETLTNHPSTLEGAFPIKIFVWYASQTGQSESISEFIFNNFVTLDGPLRHIRDRLGVENVQRFCISEYEKWLDDFWLPTNHQNQKHLPGCYLLILVASSTGQGDPPDKACRFFRWLRRLKSSLNNRKTSVSTVDDIGPLKHLSFALLGLGDTNYDTFANFPKLLSKLFTELGASPYVIPEFADDAVGLELVTEPFIENLIETLSTHYETSHKLRSESKSNTPSNKNQSILENNEFGDCCCDITAAREATIKKFDDIENESVNEAAFSIGLVETKKKMNINRPVVSSCLCLSSSDKCFLSDVCRQLIEPSNKLLSIQEDQLELPKCSLSMVDKFFVSSKKNLEEFLIKSDVPQTEQNSTNKELVSLKNHLQKKVKSTLFEGRVKLTKILSNCENRKFTCCHKTKIVLECDAEYRVLDGSDQNFVPGDSFGFYSSNELIDVYQTLISVTVQDFEGDEPISLWDYFKGNKKQVYILLNDKKTVVELLPYLVYGIDLKTLPKKAALRRLADYTEDQQQRRRLLELSSKQGDNEYHSLVLGHHVTFCDILRLFDTCHPPLSVLLAYLLPSKPRYFSACNIPEIVPTKFSTTETKNNDENQSSLIPSNNDQNLCRFKILFSVSNSFSHTFMRASENLLGLFSGKFFQHYTFLPDNYHCDFSCNNLFKSLELIHDNVLNSGIHDNQDVRLIEPKMISFSAYIFRRPNLSFNLAPSVGDDDLKKTLILISTGTGIAPFLSYLESREKRLSLIFNETIDDNKKMNCRDHRAARDDIGQIFFFFGCRHPYQDFAHSNRLVNYSLGSRPLINHLCLCFSRCSKSDLTRFESDTKTNLCCSTSNITNVIDDSVTVKHVDQLIVFHGQELVDLIVQKNASIYVCGNWKTIAKDITKAFCHVLSRYHFGNNDEDLIDPEAAKFFKQMQQDKRFLQDVWI